MLGVKEEEIGKEIIINSIEMRNIFVICTIYIVYDNLKNCKYFNYR